MKNNTKERKVLRTGIAVIIAVLLIVFFQASHFQLQERNHIDSLYIVIGIFNVAIYFSIFTQNWTYASLSLSRKRLYVGILFLCALIPDIIHTLGAVGFPLFHWVLSVDGFMWMMILSRTVIALGMLMIICMRDQVVSVSFKTAALIVGVLPILTIIVLLLVLLPSLPGLINEHGMTTLKKMWDAVILIILLIAAGLNVYQVYIKRAAESLNLVAGLSFFIVGQFLFATSTLISDLSHLLGLVCGCIGSYLFLAGSHKHAFQAPLLEKRMSEAQFNYLAYHDELTGLPNLRKLTHRLEALIEKEPKVDRLTIAVLNFNRFKMINESLGREAGDRILKMASKRIIDEVRNGEEVYSMGGDEFAVILIGGISSEQITARIAKFIELFKEPLQFETGDYHLSLSAGFAVYPEDAIVAEQLVQNADTAVHDIKGQQKYIQRYIPSMQLKAQERLIMETELRRGLEREEFFLEYQPLVWLETDQVVGMEALVRWNHPDRGIVYPGDFISIAEDSGLIVPLGEWVLRQACQQNKQWQKTGYKPICVSVNLSLGQFIQPNLAERIGTILDEIGLDPQYVELEITESMTLDKEAALDQLYKLKRLGVRISIDDFGTGYSSLHYLKNLPIDRLKIDRTFVNEILQDNNNAAIVSTIATMAHHLKLKVTAEGVETADQLNFLKNQQCHEGQGYYFSRPIRAWDFERAFLMD
ncbi:putative bifunctional diguanylate cyclase/phosphodiesterase [Paenibacillus dakarensis]|uniref:putative bifunctional diguanylate cyclase/phosphodiesterase n=1 Tax=Paenibacillus dakarensis TaxID=1527293 RepID=UPI0006D54529|nr:EAL domain-containing protein [Paenibacillus dakarensis]